MIALNPPQFHDLLWIERGRDGWRRDPADRRDHTWPNGVCAVHGRVPSTRLVTMITVLGLLLCVAGQQVASRGAPEFHAGTRFRAEIQAPFSGSWSNVPLRDLLKQLSAQRKLGILLDRRIDPTLRLPLEISNQSLDDGLQDLARRAGAALSIPENVLYLGPTTATSRLRTLIELRTLELSALVTAATGPAGGRRAAPSPRRLTIAWDDLATPREILDAMAGQFGIRLEGLDVIPHDQWAAATLPDVTAAEALSLVLIQFDRTFRWGPQGQVAIVIAAPEDPVVERRHRVRGRSARDRVPQLMAAFPELQITAAGDDVLVSATVESHDAVTAFLDPSSTSKSAVVPVTPLRQRTFTLTFRRVPVADVMKKLEQTGIVFDYDRAAFAAAGVDWSQAVDMELQMAPADQFLQTLFAAFPVSFEVDRVTVRLRLKQ